MERYAKAITLSLLTLVAFATLIPSASAATIPQLRSRLDYARHHLYAARARLATARSDYQIVLSAYQVQDAAATTTDGTSTPVGTALTDVTGDSFAGLTDGAAALVLADQRLTQDDVGQLATTVSRRRAIVRRWHALADRLKRQLAIACWNRSGEWKPLIAIAAAHYSVSADGLYRLMQFESGGNRYAGSTYRGLFQYYPGTWRGGWNPWSDQSIFNGWAQIRATAYAIHRGMGPSQWPNTYRMAF